MHTGPASANGTEAILVSPRASTGRLREAGTKDEGTELSTAGEIDSHLQPQACGDIDQSLQSAALTDVWKDIIRLLSVNVKHVDVFMELSTVMPGKVAVVFILGNSILPGRIFTIRRNHFLLAQCDRRQNHFLIDSKQNCTLIE